MLVEQRNGPVVVEHRHRVDQLDSVCAEIALGFFRVPFKFQLRPLTVYTVHQLFGPSKKTAEKRFAVFSLHRCSRFTWKTWGQRGARRGSRSWICGEACPPIRGVTCSAGFAERSP